MDTLAGLLDAPRARGAFTLRATMSAPWSLRIAAESPLTLIAGVANDVWIVPDESEPLCLGAGDIAVTRAPAHYTVAGNPDTAPQIIIKPGQHCVDLHGNPVTESLMHGVRTWGNDPAGDTEFLVGAYEHLSDISDRLLRALPPVLLLQRKDWQSPLVAMLADQLMRDEPGQAAVLDRILDLLLTAVLRAWFARQDPHQPDWWRTQRDPLIERAVRLMHEDPAFPWTMQLLASRVGASRASLARRFQELVGEAPMTFLKQWRLARAADLLCEPGATVSTVAEQVGYASPYAFSTAFKRVRGISPSQHRDAVMTKARG